MKEAFTRKSLLILGRGIGQVMFQNNALSGLLMLIGIFLNSWQMGLLAVSSNIISTLTALISGLHYPFYPFCMDAVGIVQLADA